MLFALPGLHVLDVTLGPDEGRQVLAEDVEAEGGCPSCWVVSSSVKDRPTCQVKELPHRSVLLRLWVRKRRFVSVEQLSHARSSLKPCGVGSRPGLRRGVLDSAPRLGGYGRRAPVRPGCDGGDWDR
jgi:hypothetical protein